MPTITELATKSIRVFPSLYPTRLTFLISVFSGSGGCSFDTTTGGFQHDHYMPDEPQFDETLSVSVARTKRLQEVAQERWISEHAEEIAQISTFDEISYLSEIRWPTVGLWPSREVEWGEMNKDTQEAFREVLYHYEQAYDDAIRVRDWPPARDTLAKPSWDFTNPNISMVLAKALAILERITGKTRDERIAEQNATIDEIIKELKAERAPI